VKSLHSWDSLALMGSRGRTGRAGNPFLRGKDLKLKVTHPLAKSYALSNAIDAVAQRIALEMYVYVMQKRYVT